MNKEIILYSEWAKAKVYVPPDDKFIDELNFIIGGEPGEDCEYEFCIKLRDVDGPTVEVTVFGDSLKAFTECREVFDLLSNSNNAIQSIGDFHIFAKQVEKLGWTKRRPHPENYTWTCRECGSMQGRKH